MKKRIQRKTPGARTVIHFKKKRVSQSKCGMCGKKLNRSRLTATQLRKLPKTKKRPERPLPELCSKCMREYFKTMVRR